MAAWHPLLHEICLIIVCNDGVGVGWRRYYAGKLNGALHIALFKATRSAAHKQQAISSLTEAAADWQAYTAVATGQYVYPQLLGRVSVLDLVGFSESVKADVEIAQRQSA